MATLLAVAGFLGAIACIIWLIICVIRRTPPKPAFNGLLICLIAMILGGILGSSSNKSDEDTKNIQAPPSETIESNDLPTETEFQPTQEPDSYSSREETVNIKTGSYDLPCGVCLLFYDSVRNDVTGRWRYSATSTSVATAGYALEYYNEMFSSDDEIHGVWNATLGTMTCIKVFANSLFVDTYEYVDGEEHDANLMFSGMLLDSRIIDIETGEEIE